jgi:hypothetical protein
MKYGFAFVMRQFFWFRQQKKRNVYEYFTLKKCDIFRQTTVILFIINEFMLVVIKSKLFVFFRGTIIFFEIKSIPLQYN